MSVVTAADIKAKTYRIRDVVLPLPGRSVSLTLPENDVGKYLLRLLRKEGIYDTVCCGTGGGDGGHDDARAVGSTHPWIKPERQGGKQCLFRHLIVVPDALEHTLLRWPRRVPAAQCTRELALLRVVCLRSLCFCGKHPSTHRLVTHVSLLPRGTLSCGAVAPIGFRVQGKGLGLGPRGALSCGAMARLFALGWRACGATKSSSRPMCRYSGDSDLMVCDDDAGGYFTSISLCTAPPAKAHAQKQKRRRHDRHGAASAHNGEEGAVGDGGGAAAGDKWALQLRFGLPPAAFATMLVREVSHESVHPALHCEKRRQAAKAVSLEARKPVTKPRSDGASREGSAPQPQAPRPGGEEDQEKKDRENKDIHRGHRPRPSTKDIDQEEQSAGLGRRRITGHGRKQDCDNKDKRRRISSASEPQRSASDSKNQIPNPEKTERAPGSRTKHKRGRSAEAPEDLNPKT